MKTVLENDMLMLIKDDARDAKDDEQMEFNQIINSKPKLPSKIAMIAVGLETQRLHSVTQQRVTPREERQLI